MDTLKVARELEGTGLSGKTSEALASVLDRVISEGAATKADVTVLRSDLKADITALRNDLKADVTALRNEMVKEFARVDGRFAAVDARFDTLEARLTAKLYGVGLTVVIAMGLVQHFFK